MDPQIQDAGGERKVKRRLRLLQQRRSGQVVSYVLVLIVGGILAKQWVFSTSLMIVYFIYWMMQTKDDYSRMELADRMYYLGYTFTLISLGWVLWDPSRYTSREAFQYFGTAVFTSILGLGLRSVIHLFYRSPEQQVDELNSRIAQIGDRVLGELNGFADNIALKVKELEQQIKESETKNRDVLTHAFENLSDTMTMTLHNASSGGVEDFKKWRQSLTLALQNYHNKVNALLSETISVADTQSKAFAEGVVINMRESKEYIDTTLLQITKELRDHQTMMATQLTDSIKITVAASTDIARLLRESTEDLKNNQINIVRTMSNMMGLQNTSFSKIKEAFDQLVDRTSYVLMMLAQNTDVIVRKVENVTDRTGKSVEEIAGAMTNNLNNINVHINQLSAKVEELQNTLPREEAFKTIDNALINLNQLISRAGLVAQTLNSLLAGFQKNLQEAKEIDGIIDELRDTIVNKLDESNKRG